MEVEPIARGALGAAVGLEAMDLVVLTGDLQETADELTAQHLDAQPPSTHPSVSFILDNPPSTVLPPPACNEPAAKPCLGQSV